MTRNDLFGERIRRILPAPPSASRQAGKPAAVEFEGGSVVDLTKQDVEFFELIKPMVWW